MIFSGMFNIFGKFDFMDIMVLWGILMLFSRFWGSKKPPRSQEEPTKASETLETTPANDEFKVGDIDWSTWGLPEEAEQIQKSTKVFKKPKIINEVAQKVITEPSPKVATTISKRIKLEEKYNPWRGKLSKKDARKGLIMAEVFGKPRALNPYEHDI